LIVVVSCKKCINQLSGAVEHVPPELVAGFDSRSGRSEENHACDLSSLGVGWVQVQLTRGAAIDSPPVKHSLRKEPGGPWRKQAQMGVADYS